MGEVDENLTGWMLKVKDKRYAKHELEEIGCYCLVCVVVAHFC